MRRKQRKEGRKGRRKGRRKERRKKRRYGRRKERYTSPIFRKCSFISFANILNRAHISGGTETHLSFVTNCSVFSASYLLVQ